MKETAASIQRNDWLTHEYYDYPPELEGTRNYISNLPENWEIGSVNGSASSGVDYNQNQTYRSLYLKLEPGEYYLSVRTKESINPSIRTWVHFYNQDKEGKRVLSWLSNNERKIVINEDDFYFRILLRFLGDRGSEIADIENIGNDLLVKLEKNTESSNWTPSPEDVGLEYNKKITNFYQGNSLLRKTISFPKKLEGRRNLLVGHEKGDYRLNSNNSTTTPIEYKNMNEYDSVRATGGTLISTYSSMFKSLKKGRKYIGSMYIKTPIEADFSIISYYGNVWTTVKANKWTRLFREVIGTGEPQRMFGLYSRDNSIANKEILFKKIHLSEKETAAYTPAPEDLGIKVPDYIQEFIPISDKNSTLASSREFIEYPEELEGGRNLVCLSNFVPNTRNYGNSGYNTDLRHSPSDIHNTFVVNVKPEKNYSLKISEKGFFHRIDEVMFDEDNRAKTVVSYLNYNSNSTQRKIFTNKETKQIWVAIHYNNSPENMSFEETKLKVEKRVKNTPWTPAPEDLGLDYPDTITEFKPCITEDYVMGREIISYPKELVGGRNLFIDSKELKNIGGRPNGISSRINEEGHLEVVAEEVNGNYASNLGLTISPEHKIAQGRNITFTVKIKSPDSEHVPSLYIGPGMSYYRLEGTMSEEFSVFKLKKPWNISNWRPHLGFSSRPGTYIFKEAKLEFGSKASPWTPAPEDLNYIYPNWVEKFKPSIQKEGIIMQDYKEGSQFIEPNQNLVHDSSSEWRTLELGTSHYRQFPTNLKLNKGETYTITIEVDKISSDNVPINFHMGYGTKGTYTRDFGGWRAGNIPFNKPVSLTYTIQETDAVEERPYLAWRLRNETNPTIIRYRNLKVESGDKATQWTPAPEDYGREEW